MLFLTGLLKLLLTNIGNDLTGKILMVNLLNLNFRKINFSKKKNCLCDV